MYRKYLSLKLIELQVYLLFFHYNNTFTLQCCSATCNRCNQTETQALQMRKVLKVAISRDKNNIRTINQSEAVF